MAQTLLIKGILSYPHLFVPKAVNKDGNPKYSTGTLIPKNDPQIAKIQAAIDAEKAAGFPEGFPPKGTLCLKDCVREFPANTELANYHFIPAGTDQQYKPSVVGMDRLPIVDQALVYPGAEAIVSIMIKHYKQAINKGVTAYLQAVMMTGNEGVLGRLDNRPSTEQIFEQVSADGQILQPGQLSLVQPAHQMTPAATGTYEQMVAVGWTDELLIQHGNMAA